MSEDIQRIDENLVPPIEGEPEPGITIPDSHLASGNIGQEELGQTAIDETLRADATDVSTTPDNLVRSEKKSRKTYEGPTEALARIRAGDASSVAYGLKGYKGLTNEVANALIDAGQGGAVSWFPEKFEGLDHDTAIIRLIDAKEADLNRRRQELLDAGYSQHDPAVVELTHRSKYRGITQNLYKFTLKPETLDELDRRGFHKSVASYRAGRTPGRGLSNNQLIDRTLATLH